MFDIIENKEIRVPESGLMRFAEGYNIHYSGFSHLFSGRASQVAHRFILAKNIDKLFHLEDTGTGQVFPCIDNASIFLHLDRPYSDNEAKYVYELRKGRQQTASICGRLLKLKGANVRFDGKTKAKNPVSEKVVGEQRLRLKITTRLRSRIRHAICNSKSTKAGRTYELLGCNSNFLIRYISAKFTKNMNWDNYGKWHIDHIKPCSQFDLTDPEEQKRCFHYTNLQPKWATTKIALEMGDRHHEGNIDKNDGGDVFDQQIADVILNHTKYIGTPEQANEMAAVLFEAGCRKFGCRTVESILGQGD